MLLIVCMDGNQFYALKCPKVYKIMKYSVEETLEVIDLTSAGKYKLVPKDRRTQISAAAK